MTSNDLRSPEFSNFGVFTRSLKPGGVAFVEALCISCEIEVPPAKAFVEALCFSCEVEVPPAKAW
jgi:hypothetical protein